MLRRLPKRSKYVKKHLRLIERYHHLLPERKYAEYYDGENFPKMKRKKKS